MLLVPFHAPNRPRTPVRAPHPRISEWPLHHLVGAGPSGLSHITDATHRSCHPQDQGPQPADE